MSHSLKSRVLLICSSIPAVLFMLGFILFVLYPLVFPLTAEKVSESYHPSSRIYDRRGVLLRETANEDGLMAFWVPYEEIDPFMVQAVIAAEDERFFLHRGIDGQALVRALFQNFSAGEIQSGASTITMQLARIIKGHRRNVLGKFAQMITARRLERGLSKEEILEQYLNRIPLGHGNIGIEAASREYFGVSQNWMSKGQMSLLAGIIQGPGIYNPADDPDLAKWRRHYVMDRMVALNMVTAGEAARIRLETVSAVPIQREPQAMHFTDYVLSGNPKPGRIETSLDNEMNTAIENLVRLHVQHYRREGLTHAAVLVLDNETMEIRAMVGSPDYWDGDQGSNNGVTMLRQPGSTLKPFTYGLAFERGWQPGDVVPDIPINYLGGEGRLYEPENITRQFSGPVMIQDALSRSLNIPAIQIANSVGAEDLLDLLHLTGFASLTKSADFYGLGLTLGNGEVSLLELTTAYAMLANRGIYRPAVWTQGPQPEGQRIFTEETDFLLTHILSDVRLRIYAFGTNNPLILSFPMAVKTGTSENWRDNWTVGYCRQFTIGVWVGAFSGEPTNQFTATAGAGPLFHQVAVLVDESYPADDRRVWDKPPAGISLREVCPLSGETPNDFCPVSVWVYYNSVFKDDEVCDVHRRVWVEDEQGERIQKVFEYLPSVYAQWEAANGRTPPPPSDSGRDILTQVLKIVQPEDGERYLLEPGYDPETQSILLRAESVIRFDAIEWYVNGELLTESPWPYETLLPTVPGEYVIQAVADGFKSQTVTIRVY